MGSGETLRKSSQDVCSKKGCDGHELLKIPESLEAWTQESEEKCQALWHFGCIWITMDKQYE